MAEYPYLSKEVLVQGTKKFFTRMLKNKPIIPMFDKADSSINTIAKDNMERFIAAEDPFNHKKKD